MSGHRLTERSVTHNEPPYKQNDPRYDPPERNTSRFHCPSRKSSRNYEPCPVDATVERPSICTPPKTVTIFMSLSIVLKSPSMASTPPPMRWVFGTFVK